MTFSSFRVEPKGSPPADFRRWLSRSLRSRGFKPIDKAGDEERSAGFVEIENHDSSELAPGELLDGEYALMTWRIDTLRISASELKAQLAAWAVAFEAEQQRPPRKAEKAARRVALRQAMRAQTDPVTKVYDVSWNVNGQTLLIWTASRKIVEQIMEALETTLEFRLHALTPSARARREEIADESLGPTPELVGIELSGEAAARFALGLAREAGETAAHEEVALVEA